MSDPIPADPDFEARCRASFARQAIMTTFGCTLTVVRPGHAEIEMPFRPDLTQQTGSLQAGVMAVLGDNAGGYAGLSLYPPGFEIVAVEFKINFLSPGLGEVIRAVGRVIKNGRTLSVMDVDVFGVTGGREKLIAKMQQTAMRVPALGGEAA